MINLSLKSIFIRKLNHLSYICYKKIYILLPFYENLMKGLKGYGTEAMEQ